MSHLKIQITNKQRGWAVETRDAGTCFVPGDLRSVPDYLKDDIEITPIEAGFEDLWASLYDYVEGRQPLSIEARTGYFGRLSAPGCLDCTAWTFDKNLRALTRALKED